MGVVYCRQQPTHLASAVAVVPALAPSVAGRAAAEVRLRDHRCELILGVLAGPVRDLLQKDIVAAAAAHAARCHLSPAVRLGPKLHHRVPAVPPKVARRLGGRYL